jgi:multiple sugar transport system permease protein
LPLAAPGAAAVAIFVAIMSWNEFLFGLTMTTGGRTSPITVGIASLVQPYQITFGEMAALGTAVALPIIVLAIVANRWIVAAVTRGAVKG